MCGFKIDKHFCYCFAFWLFFLAPSLILMKSAEKNRGRIKIIDIWEQSEQDQSNVIDYVRPVLMF